MPCGRSMRSFIMCHPIRFYRKAYSISCRSAREPGVRRGELLLNITGLDRSIRVRGRVVGAKAFPGFQGADLISYVTGYWRRRKEELGRNLHRMFLIESPVVAFSMERHGASGAAAVPGAVPQLRVAHLRRLDDGAGALPGAAGEAGSELDDVRGQSRTSKPQAGRVKHDLLSLL